MVCLTIRKLLFCPLSYETPPAAERMSCVNVMLLYLIAVTVAMGVRSAQVPDPYSASSSVGLNNFTLAYSDGGEPGFRSTVS